MAVRNHSAPWRGIFSVLALLSLLNHFGSCAETESAPGFDLFTNGPILRLRMSIDPEDMARLRRDSREDVPCTVQEGPETFTRVAVRLKGSTGSFRPIDDKPAFTLNFGRVVQGQRFHGLRKIQLNNSVEDPGFFNEFAGAELFRRAGVPAPRVAHALVELNGRRLGLYVLKEGFAEEFLELHFQKTNGNLYDTGTGWDVDQALEKDQGDGPDDRSDLRALADATREPDLARRWLRLGQLLDLERFVSFMAMEVIACHRDGYSLARNNYRIYHDPGADRMVFLPHGMDQLFGRPDATIRPAMQGLVARAVMETPQGRHDFRKRLAVLTTNALDVPALHRQADALLARVRPLLEPAEARALAEALAGVKERIARRRQSLELQLREPEPGLLRFENGLARLSGWKPVGEPTNGRLDQTLAPDGRKALHLHAGSLASASWRTTVLLAKGRYGFRAEVFTRAVEALDFGNNRGAGLRVVGGTRAPPYELLGDQDWTLLEQSFEIEREQEVELICELRARAGEAWFDVESLRLIKEPQP